MDKMVRTKMALIDAIMLLAALCGQEYITVCSYIHVESEYAG